MNGERSEADSRLETAYSTLVQVQSPDTYRWLKDGLGEIDPKLRQRWLARYSALLPGMEKVTEANFASTLGALVGESEVLEGLTGELRSQIDPDRIDDAFVESDLGRATRRGDFLRLPELIASRAQQFSLGQAADLSGTDSGPHLKRFRAIVKNILDLYRAMAEQGLLLDPRANEVIASRLVQTVDHPLVHQQLNAVRVLARADRMISAGLLDEAERVLIGLAPTLRRTEQLQRGPGLFLITDSGSLSEAMGRSGVQLETGAQVMALLKGVLDRLYDAPGGAERVKRIAERFASAESHLALDDIPLRRSEPDPKLMSTGAF